MSIIDQMDFSSPLQPAGPSRMLSSYLEGGGGGGFRREEEVYLCAIVFRLVDNLFAKTEH